MQSLLGIGFIVVALQIAPAEMSYILLIGGLLTLLVFLVDVSQRNRKNHRFLVPPEKHKMDPHRQAGEIHLSTSNSTKASTDGGH